MTNKTEVLLIDDLDENNQSLLDEMLKSLKDHEEFVIRRCKRENLSLYETRINLDTDHLRGLMLKNITQFRSVQTKFGITIKKKKRKV